jgi:predicted MFS family arabinose efflux permease
MVPGLSSLPRNLTLIYLVVITTYTAEGFVNVVMAPYLRSQGIEVAQIGGIIAAMSLASLISRFPAGLLYHPRRANRMMACGSLLVAGATFFYPRVEGELLLGLLRLVHGFSLGVVTTLNMAQFFDVRPPSFERGRAMGIMAAALAGGNMIGNLIGGWWADRFGYSAAFALAALFPVMAAVINLQIKHPAGESHKARVGKGAAGFRAALQVAVRPEILMAATLLLSVNFLNAAFNPFFNLYALGVGLSLTTIGVIKSFGSSASVFTRVFAGELGRRWSADAISRVALTLSAGLLILLPSFTALLALGAIAIGVSVLRAILTVTGAVSVMDATDTTPQQRGIASSVFNMGKDVGSICGPFFGGIVASAVSISGMFRVLPLAVLAGYWLMIGGFAAGERRRGRRAVSPAAADDILEEAIEAETVPVG